MDIGIPDKDMVRLGGKSTDRTKALLMRNQVSNNNKLTKHDYRCIDSARQELLHTRQRLERVFRTFSTRVSGSALMEYLEFAPESLPFYDTFFARQDTDGMQRVGKKGKTVGAYYLLDRWRNGCVDAGVLQNQLQPGCIKVWQIPAQQRPEIFKRWYTEIQRSTIEELQKLGNAYDRKLEEVHELYNSKDAVILRTKRVIGCTTTGAAMQANLLKAASVEVLVVEEAGEILEAHVITAMSPKTEQLILIGDHLQLRPKINNYALSVEKGEGYDLNRSLFERLILKGLPHVTLSEQHRMRPEISSLIRHLTYPELTDGIGTQKRPDIRGLRGNVIFCGSSRT